MSTQIWNANSELFPFTDETDPPWKTTATPAVDGDTIAFETANDPASGQPEAGTFSFLVDAALSPNLRNWLGNGSAVGSVTVNDAGASPVLPPTITTTLTVTAGTASTSGSTSVAGLVTVAGTLDLTAGNLTADKVTDPAMTLAGGTLILAGATLDSATVINVTANSAITLSEGGADVIYGGINAGAYTIDWTGQGTLIVDQAGTLNLGAASVTGLAVTISAATTLGANMSINDFTVDAALTAATKTVTCNNFDWSDNAALVAGSVLTVTVNDACSFTFTAGGTVAGTLNLVVPLAAAVTGAWNTTSYQLSSLTVEGTLTLTGNTYTKILDGSGTIDLNNAGALAVRFPGAANFWTFDGTLANTGGAQGVAIYLNADRANAAEIDTGTVPVLQIDSNDRTLTASGGITCALLEVGGLSGTNATTIVCGAAGPLNVSGVLRLGAGGNTCVGKVTLSGAGHSIGGLIVKALNTSTVHTFTLTGTGTLALGGSITQKNAANGKMTLALGAFVITASANANITGDGSTATTSNGATIVPGAYTVTITNLEADASNIVYAVGCVDGGGNGAGVLFVNTAKKKSKRFGRFMGVRAI